MRSGVKAMTSAGVVLALLLTLLVTAATPGGANENESGLCDRVGDVLSWTAAPDALDAEYNVRRFTRSDSVWVDTITVADGPATLTVDPDGSYFVRYRTVDNNGSTTIVDELCTIQREPTTPQVCVRSSFELLTLTPSLLGEVRSNRMHLRTVEADGSSAFLATLPANDVQYALGGNTIGDPNDTFILRYRELDGTVVDLPCATG